MRSLLALLLAAAISPVLSSCGSDNCVDGCNRMKSCAEKLNCGQLDPLQQPRCNQAKKALSGTDCAPLAAYCDPSVKDRFEQAATCPLHPITCECQ